MYFVFFFIMVSLMIVCILGFIFWRSLNVKFSINWSKISFLLISLSIYLLLYMSIKYDWVSDDQLLITTIIFLAGSIITIISCFTKKE